MAFLQQFQWWRARCKKHPPDDIHRAGELSELRLEKLSRAAGKANGWHVFASVRIPDPADGGRREIDLVIVGGNTLLVVEQKHWAEDLILIVMKSLFNIVIMVAYTTIVRLPRESLERREC